MFAGEAFQLVHESSAESASACCRCDEDPFDLSDAVREQAQAGASPDRIVLVCDEERAVWEGQIVAGVVADRSVDLLFGRLPSVVPAGDLVDVAPQDLAGFRGCWVP